MANRKSFGASIHATLANGEGGEEADFVIVQPADPILAGEDSDHYYLAVREDEFTAAKSVSENNHAVPLYLIKI